MAAVLWFTGLSGAGKTTIAQHLKQALEVVGQSVLVLDGDAVRATHHRHLGFTPKDIHENNRGIAQMASEYSKHYDVIIIPIISPYAADRAAARVVIGDSFVEVYVHCPIEVCVERDTKGLYSRAHSGTITNLIGVSETMPYEPPEHPEITIRTAQESITQSVSNIMAYLHK